MWLEKKERRLLALYYRKLDKVGGYKTYKEMGLLNTDEQDDKTRKDVEELINDNSVANKLNDYLYKRKLIEIQYGNGPVILIALTLEGYDLGRKYNNWFSKLGLWWQEHKMNPLWIILGFIITIVTSYLIGKLT